jgi:Protein of unknown function (DUF3551)
VCIIYLILEYEILNLRYGKSPLPAALLVCQGIGRLLCRDGQHQSRCDERDSTMPPLKSVFAFAVVAASLCMIRASHAYQTGDAKWCRVTNKGADSMQWECEYETSEECAAAVAGTGGYCAINPFWRPDQSSNGH